MGSVAATVIAAEAVNIGAEVVDASALHGNGLRIMRKSHWVVDDGECLNDSLHIEIEDQII